MKLEKGSYNYKFIVDGNWVCDEDANKRFQDGIANNYVEIVD